MEAGVAAGAGTAALALFDYNRMNFRVDNITRIFRFINSKNYSIAQVNQYRADIRNLTAMTTTRCGVCHTINTINMAICTAFFCAGRLGLHGPAPPGWFMGIYLTCIASAFCLQGISYWLAMHANLRATAASVQLLTRYVRLPIPSVKQLDRARQVGSAFEKQRFRDIFRVPFVAPHAMKHPAAGASDDEYLSDIGSQKLKSKSMRRSNSEPTLGSSSKENHRSMPHLDHKRGVPGWFADEWETDRGHRTAIPGGADGVPGHFKLYGAAQADWWSHDVYSRICMTIGMIFFVNAGSCYVIGTGHCELRAMWMTYASTLMFATAIWALIHLDFSPKFGSAFSGFEYCAPMCPILTNIAMSLEYRAEYNEGAKTAVMIIVCLAYLCFFLFTLRVIDLATPDYSIAKERPDTPGLGWWPANWRLPSSFANIILLVAPPTKEMLKDHPCLLNEMARHGTPGASRRRRRPQKSASPSKKSKGATGAFDEDDDGGMTSGTEDDAEVDKTPLPPEPQPNDPLQSWGADYRQMREQMPKPWDDVVRVALTVIALMWIAGLAVRIVEFARGDQAALLKVPGDPPWGRDPNKTKENDFVNYPHHRRLSFQFSTQQRDHMYYGLEELHKVMPIIENEVAKQRPMGTQQEEEERIAELTWRLKTLESRMTASEGDLVVDPQGLAYDALSLAAVPVSWPAVFEPQAMACSSGQIIAVTPYGFGALASIVGNGKTEMVSFALGGVLDTGSPLLSASWGHDGLFVAMQDGSLAKCAGKAPTQGNWACGPFGNNVKLPVGPKELAAAALTEVPDQNGTPVFFSALVEEGGSTVGVFVLEGFQWAPLGEVALPRRADGKPQRAALAFSGSELLVMTEDGSVTRQEVPDGVPTQVALPEDAQKVGMTQRLWRGACHLGEGRIARLALRPSDETVWHPELFVH